MFARALLCRPGATGVEHPLLSEIEACLALLGANVCHDFKHSDLHTRGDLQIGRASCRERV